MTKPTPTSIAKLRADLGLTLEEFGACVGLKSKGQVSEIEKSGKCSPETALAIERLSAGAIDAALLNATVNIVRRSMAA